MKFTSNVGQKMLAVAEQAEQGTLRYNWEFSDSCSTSYFFRCIFEDEEEINAINSCCIGSWSYEYQVWIKHIPSAGMRAYLYDILQKYGITLDIVIFFEYCGLVTKEELDTCLAQENEDVLTPLGYKGDETYNNLSFVGKFFRRIGEKIIEESKETGVVDSSLVLEKTQCL